MRAGLPERRGESGYWPAVKIAAALIDLRKYSCSTRSRLQEYSRGYQSGGQEYCAAWAKLQRDAQKALGEGPFSIVNKGVTPPSGDKHDYMSQAPYFWPDPKSANGLPYIRRDGERNPEINKITDHHSLDRIEECSRDSGAGLLLQR